MTPDQLGRIEQKLDKIELRVMAIERRLSFYVGGGTAIGVMIGFIIELVRR